MSEEDGVETMQDDRDPKQRLADLWRAIKENRIARKAGWLGAGLLVISILVKEVVSPYLSACLRGSQFFNVFRDIGVVLTDLLRDVGIACIVSAFVAFMLERRSKRAIEGYYQSLLSKLKGESDRRFQTIESNIAIYIDKLGKGVVQAVYAREIPPKLFAIVRQTILEQPLVRSFYKTDVKMSEFNDRYVNDAQTAVGEALRECQRILGTALRPAGDFIVLDMESSYQVRNISDRPYTGKIPFRVAARLGAGCPGQCGITSFDIDHDERMSREPKLYRDDDGDWLVHEVQVSIPPGDSIEVCIQGYALRRAADSEPWLILMPSDGMSVKATDADRNKKMTLTLFGPKLANEPESATNGDTNVVRLKTSQFLLPYQGIEIKWSRCPEQQAGSQAAAP